MVSAYDQQTSHISFDAFFSVKLVNELLPLFPSLVPVYGYSVYDFTDDNNLIEEPGLPPLNKIFLFREKDSSGLRIFQALTSGAIY